MCEFKVFLDNEEVFEGAVYAKATGSQVTVGGILGTTKKIENVKIAEVDVTTERLVLAKL